MYKDILIINVRLSLYVCESSLIVKAKIKPSLPSLEIQRPNDRFRRGIVQKIGEEDFAKAFESPLQTDNLISKG